MTLQISIFYVSPNSNSISISNGNILINASSNATTDLPFNPQIFAGDVGVETALFFAHHFGTHGRPSSATGEPGKPSSSNLPALGKLEGANLVRRVKLDEKELEVYPRSSGKALICLWVVHPIGKFRSDLDTNFDIKLEYDAQ